LVIIKECKVDDCKNKVLTNDYCTRHMRFFRKYGKIPERTVMDRNEIIITVDHAEIILYNAQQKEIARALIDLEDVERVKLHKWRLRKDNYVEGTKNQIAILLHRLIMNAPKDITVDHIEHNKLDNRKHMLRLCTLADNNKNNELSSRNKSGINGVFFEKKTKKWRATLTVDYKKKYVGSSYDLNEAIQMRLDAEDKYYGEYALRRQEGISK